MNKNSQRILERMQALLRQHGVTVGEGLMLCGLSGGADSIALVLALREVGCRVRALHCNFHLRGEESQRDELFVTDFCRRRGIDLTVKHFDTAAEANLAKESIEMAARRLRYDWFRQTAKQLSAETAAPVYICVAHHADDNVETLLLNLIRGAGLHGLTGMRVVNDSGIVRPFLQTTRREILALLEDWGATYVTDSSNAELCYRRNRIRHELLPLLREMNPSIDETLRRTMTLLAEAEATLQQKAPETTERYREWMGLGFSSTQIRQILQGRNGAYAQAGGYILTRHRGEIICAPCPKPCPEQALNEGRHAFASHSFEVKRLPWPSAGLSLRQPHTAVIDAAAVAGALTVRSLRPADRFSPFGMKGSRLVSDYLTDRHRSRLDKLAALVVCDARGILWLVGETIDQRAAVTNHTSSVLVISYQSNISRNKY